MLSWFVALGLASGAQDFSVSACAAITSDTQRLGCYDTLFRDTAGGNGQGAAALDTTSVTPVGAAGTVAAAASDTPAVAATAPATPATGAPGTPTAAKREVAPIDEFGLTGEQKAAKQPDAKPATEAIEAQVVSVTRLSTERFTFVLDNEQVWTQVEGSLRQPFHAGETIRIRKAALGSFVATGPRSGGGVRVRRVK